MSRLDTRYAPAPPRRRSWLRGLLITLVVLAGLAVAADRIALLVAERIAADQFQKSQHLPQRPSVSIAGFPFLTQLASGDYDEVTVRAHGLVVGSQRPVRLSALAVDLHRVVVTNSFRDFSARRATAEATISYAELSRTLGATITYAGDGRIHATKRVTLFGRSVEAGATAVPSATSAGLTFRDVQVTVRGVPVSSSVNDALGRVFAAPLPLGNLPFGARVTRVDTTRAGIVVHLRGHDLTYTRS